MPKTENRLLLEEAELRTPGLALFGRNRTRSAQAPLAQHVHPGCLEMVAVCKGCERYTAEDASYEVRGGEVFLARADQLHGTGVSEQGISEFFWFQLRVVPEGEEEAEGFLGLSRENADRLRTRLLQLPCGAWVADGLAMKLIDQSFSAFLHPSDLRRIGAQALFVAGLERLVRGAEAQRTPMPDARIEAVCRHIDAHVEETLQLDRLCMVAGLSLSAFKRRFRDITGQTPREYVNQQKIARAKILLASGRDITETAMTLGFSGSDYFSVVFKRHTAATPSAWQREHAHRHRK